MKRSTLISPPFKTAPISRRKLVTLRACDLCRKRKVKCDGRERMREAETHLLLDDNGSVLGVPCSNCLVSGKQCNYGKDPPPRATPKGYMDYMEDRQERIEKILARLSPYTDYSEEIGPTVLPGKWKDDCNPTRGGSQRARLRSTAGGPLPLRPHHARGPQRVSSSEDPPGDSYLKLDIKRLPTLPTATAVKMKKNKSIEFQEWRPDQVLDDIVLTSSDEEYGDATSPRLGDLSDECTRCNSLSSSGTRFHGKSSSIRLARAALKIQRKSQTGVSDVKPEEPQSGRPQENSKSTTSDKTLPTHAQSIPWPPFPPSGLLQTLVNLYFFKSNIIWPLLHRPTFDADLLCQRHKRDLGFACVVLGVCAIGSRYCTDNRVLAKVRRKNEKERSNVPSWPTDPWDGADPWIDDLEQDLKYEDPVYEDACEGSVGWKYYDRMQHCYATMMMTPVTLPELQTAFLMQQFLRGMPGVSTGWVMTGAAIRKAQDRGAHRQKVYGRSLEDELWKRAFWCLVVADRFGSAMFGRTCLSRDEDIDVELPVEIDDEFLSASGEPGNLSAAPKQPAGRPSQIVAFSFFLKLSVIWVWSLRTQYTIEESKGYLGLSAEGWEQDVVCKLNGALDEWVASIPAHLKWNPTETNPIWRAQSASLFLIYHLLQIQIYQCFIQGAKLSGPPSSISLGGTRRVSGLPPHRFSSAVSQSFPAVAICAHAARSNARILKSLLSNVRPGEKAWTELSDIPTLAVAAFLSGSTMLSVRFAKRLVAVSSGSTKIHQTRPMEGGDEDGLLSVCMEMLRAVQDRWPRAGVALNLVSTAALGHEPSTGPTAGPSSTPTSQTVASLPTRNGPATTTLPQDTISPPTFPNDAPASLAQKWRTHDPQISPEPLPSPYAPRHHGVAGSRYEPYPGNGRAGMGAPSLQHSYNVPPVAQHLTAIPTPYIPWFGEPAVQSRPYPGGVEPTTNQISTFERHRTTPHWALHPPADPVRPLQMRTFIQNPATTSLYHMDHGAPPESHGTSSSSQTLCHIHEGVAIPRQEPILAPPPPPVFSAAYMHHPPGGHNRYEPVGRPNDAQGHRRYPAPPYTARGSSGEETTLATDYENTKRLS